MSADVGVTLYLVDAQRVGLARVWRAWCDRDALLRKADGDEGLVGAMEWLEAEEPDAFGALLLAAAAFAGACS